MTHQTWKTNPVDLTKQEVGDWIKEYCGLETAVSFLGLPWTSQVAARSTPDLSICSRASSLHPFSVVVNQSLWWTCACRGTPIHRPSCTERETQRAAELSWSWQGLKWNVTKEIGKFIWSKMGYYSTRPRRLQSIILAKFAFFWPVLRHSSI